MVKRLSGIWKVLVVLSGCIRCHLTFRSASDRFRLVEAFSLGVEGIFSSAKFLVD